jgi:hypothetical protein
MFGASSFLELLYISSTRVVADPNIIDSGESDEELSPLRRSCLDAFLLSMLGRNESL